MDLVLTMGVISKEEACSTPSPPLESTVFEEKSFPEVQQAIRLG